MTAPSQPVKQGFWERFWENARKSNLEAAAMKYDYYRPYLHGKVMDYGCGEGSFLEYLRQNTDLEVLGVDVYNNSWYDFELLQWPGGDLPLEENSVDCSTANFVLHHTPDPEASLKDLVRVTRDKIILLEDMPTNTWENFVLHINHVVFDIFMIVLSKFADFQWGSDFRYRFRTDDQWKGIFERVGATLVEERDIKTDYTVPFKMYVLTPGSR